MRSVLSPEWWYAAMLRLLPRELRREYGADMLATFRARRSETRHRTWRYAAFVLRELAGVMGVAITERFHRGRGSQLVAARSTSRIGGVSGMEHAARELRHALRRLRRTPAFTVAAVFTLSLAIGANVTVFTLLQRIVLAPLPYAASDRLVWLDHGAPGVELPSGVGMTTGLYREYTHVPALEALALYRFDEGTITGDGEPARVRYMRATPSLTELLGARPARGRWFDADDGGPEGAAVAVLTHQFWSSRFGADAAALGRTVHVDGIAHEVIGVMPPAFAFPDPRAQLILPLRPDPAEARFGSFNYNAVARLRVHTSLDALRGQLDGIIAQLPQRFPEDAVFAQSVVEEAKLRALPVSMKARLLNGVDRTLWVLLGAALIVLLIACANLANLFLVRADARQREVAVRRALGAGPGKVAGFHLAETLLVALVSAALGLLLAHAGIAVIGARAPSLPRLHEVRIDGVSGAYTLLVALLAGVGFATMQLVGRIPALSAVLQDSARGSTAGRRAMHGRQLLMVGQVSLAVVLLVAAGLMMQSFVRLQRVDPGFRVADALVFTIGLPESGYPTRTAAASFHEQLLARLHQLPGVQHAAATTKLPLDGDGWGDPLTVRGAAPDAPRLKPIVRYRRVSPAFFDALAIRLRRGRLLTPEDVGDNVSVAVINEALAQQYFRGQDPIGQGLRPFGGEEGVWFTIVGVVANTATYSMRDSEPVAKLYFPLRTRVTEGTPSAHTASYVVRATTAPLALLPAVRRIVDELDANVAIARPETLQDMAARTSAQTTFAMLLLVIASIVAVVLGVVGVYAVISYAVARRTGEIGVRLALGARPGDVTDMIVRQSSRTIAVGVVLGVCGASASAGALRSLLFGVAPRDVATYGAVAIGLFVVALIASWVPARRAARISPLVSMNQR